VLAALCSQAKKWRSW